MIVSLCVTCLICFIDDIDDPNHTHSYSSRWRNVVDLPNTIDCVIFVALYDIVPLKQTCHRVRSEVQIGGDPSWSMLGRHGFAMVLLSSLGRAATQPLQRHQLPVSAWRKNSRSCIQLGDVRSFKESGHTGQVCPGRLMQ